MDWIHNVRCAMIESSMGGNLTFETLFDKATLIGTSYVEQSDSWFLYANRPTAVGTYYIFVFVGANFGIYKYVVATSGSTGGLTLLKNGGAYLGWYGSNLSYTTSSSPGTPGSSYNYTYVYGGTALTYSFNAPTAAVDAVLSGLTKQYSAGVDNYSQSDVGVKASLFSPTGKYLIGAYKGRMQIGEIVSYSDSSSQSFTSLYKSDNSAADVLYMQYHSASGGGLVIIGGGGSSTPAHYTTGAGKWTNATVGNVATQYGDGSYGATLISVY